MHNVYQFWLSCFIARMFAKRLLFLFSKGNPRIGINGSLQANFKRSVSVSVEPATEFFQLSSGEKLAYKKTTGARHPGVLFMPGLLANMTGEKARILEQYCLIHNHPYIRYDQYLWQLRSYWLCCVYETPWGHLLDSLIKCMILS